MTDDINKSNKELSLEPDAIFSHTGRYNPLSLHLFQKRKITQFSVSSKAAYLQETMEHSWQPDITASSLHSSKICLIGFFHHKGSQLHSPRTEQTSGRIRGYEGQFHFKRYDFYPRNKWDGFHTGQFGGSAHTAYTAFNGWPQATWAKNAKRLSGWRRQRGEHKAWLQ